MTPLEALWSDLRAHTNNSDGETDLLLGHLEKVAVLAAIPQPISVGCQDI
jgi:hypothetical protein